MIEFWGTTAGSILMTLLISMVPVLELRAAIPAGVIAGLDIPVVVAAAIIGNLIPIPFIIVFIRKIFKWMQTKSEKLAALVKRLEDKADRKKDKVLKYEFWGLMFFVAIPLPGTGAWTGSLIASLLEIDIKKSSLAILTGIIMATVIMYVASYGVVGNLVH